MDADRAPQLKPTVGLLLSLTMRFLLITTAAILIVSCGSASAQRGRSSVRSIDFANFTYPGVRETSFSEQIFKLRKGKYGNPNYGMTLVKTLYGDVTGDGNEEALLIFKEESDGNAAYNYVYIYGVESRRPKLLWAFMTGDRADGGLRRVYAQQGRLTLELFGKETTIEDVSPSENRESTGLCCPRSVTRTRYRWRKGWFKREGPVEVRTNPAAESECPSCIVLASDWPGIRGAQSNKALQLTKR